MKLMSDDGIRIAIAEACGWTFDGEFPDPNICAWARPDCTVFMKAPDYPNDLNAIHEAVMDLKSRDGRAYMRYQQELIRQDGLLYPDATARQRCLAFLKVTAGHTLQQIEEMLK